MHELNNNNNRDITRRQTKITSARLNLPANDNRFRILDRIDKASASSNNEDEPPNNNNNRGSTTRNTDRDTRPSLR